MTDAHFHRDRYATFLALDGAERRFLGVHPWQADEGAFDHDALRAALLADRTAGVGEIGLDRLHTPVVTPAQRTAFEAQLGLAAYLARPVVLHGARCWGEVVKACRPYAGRIPAFLFHGFSRSAGLLPEIFSLNGYISVGPAILNDHAVNYRELAANLPEDRVLVETDAEWTSPAEHQDRLNAIVASLAAVRGVSPQALAVTLAANLAAFLRPHVPSAH